MTLNMTNFDPILKEYYDGQMVENLIYKKNPLLAILPKFENWGGRNYPLPNVYANPQNRSAAFATASGLTSASSVESFLLTSVKNYSLATIDGETILASNSAKGAFEAGMQLEIDGAFQSLANDIAFSLARDSSGYRAQVNAEPSVASTTVITLKEAKDIHGFEINQSIVIFSAKSGGSQRIYDTGVTEGLISAIDRSAGTITVNTAYTANGTIAADDFIFVEGDRGLKVSGLEDWIPDSAPGATSFFGVDRSVDADRLGGVRTSGTAMPIEEALILGASEVDENGGSPDFCFVHNDQYRKLIQQLGSKVQYQGLEVGEAKVGFQGVVVHGASGPITVLADRNIRNSRAYLLDMSTWKLCSRGPLTHILNQDGLKIQRSASADSYEVRIGSYSQLGCMAPGKNGVVTLD
jgi:hypothetical protein